MGDAQRKKITAWHEAGHIVVGTQPGFRLTRASIKSRDVGDGEISCGHTEWEPIASDETMPVICMALAGQAVEEIRYGKASHDGLRDDQAVIQTFAWISNALRNGGYVLPDELFIPRLTAVYRKRPDRVPLKVKGFATELVGQAMPETVRVLNDHWSDVERVATLLLKNTTVTPDLLPRTLTQSQE